MRFLCIFAAVFLGTCVIAARFIHPGGDPQFRYGYGPERDAGQASPTATAQDQYPAGINHGTITQQNGGTP